MFERMYRCTCSVSMESENSSKKAVTSVSQALRASHLKTERKLNLAGFVNLSGDVVVVKVVLATLALPECSFTAEGSKCNKSIVSGTTSSLEAFTPPAEKVLTLKRDGTHKKSTEVVGSTQSDGIESVSNMLLPISKSGGL